MTQEAMCLNPVVIKQRVEYPMFNVFVDYDRGDYINQRKLYTLDLEITAKCAGSCLYCHTGSSDGGFFYCRTNMGVKPDGAVCPCLAIADYYVGNVYQQSLTEIFEQNRDTILFNHEIRGFCGSGHCENSDICNGCRSNAYHCLGDVHESDPTCFLNPDAKEFYFQDRIK